MYILIFILSSMAALPVASEGTQPISASKSETCPYADKSIKVPEGFCARIYADQLGHTGHLSVYRNGTVYVALENHEKGGIVELQDRNHDGQADEIQYFDNHDVTGITIHQEHLYFSTTTQVFRYSLPKHDTPPELIVDQLYVGNTHSTKSLAIDTNNNLYVNIGAPSNNCQIKDRSPHSPGQNPCPLLAYSGGIWRFKANKLGQTQAQDGLRYASGIRNAVAIQWHPRLDRLFIVQHGRDQLHELWPEFYTEHDSAELPAEEMLHVEKNSSLAWPYCYYDQRQEKYLDAPEYGGNGKSDRICQQFQRPIAAFPGHFAPNALLFYTGEQFPTHYQDGAFIAFHGSWNRAPLPQAGYRVDFLPRVNEQFAKKSEIFAAGFAGKEQFYSPGEARYRPSGLAQGPNGEIYIADSNQGRIWKIVYLRK